MRQKYGNRWNRMPSSSINAQFKQNIQEYTAKMQQAVQTDNIIESKFKEHGQAFALLSKTKNELG